MKTYSLILAVALAAAAGYSQAENTQQTKMKECNTQAKAQNLAGDSRKSFMKTCLSNQPAGSDSGLNSQQQKMKQCNADAKSKGLKGDERKTFMSSCLKG